MKYFYSALFIIFCTLCSAQPEFELRKIGSKNFLSTPWDLQYGPDGFLWVTERTKGRILRVNKETAEVDELLKIADLYTDARQDGLLGMAIHKEILGEQPYLYVSYTVFVGGERQQQIVRYTYSIENNDGVLEDPLIILSGMPSSNDHNSGRMLFGPDNMIYYTIGDQGANQNSNYCDPVLSQVLPTQSEIDSEDWSNYPGKILRISTDGSIPADNPVLDGVRSHIFSYGHRNPQGIVFGTNGILYSDEHGPDTDDEVNIISAGKNYGWPNVAGNKDDQAYDYCNWSSASNCGDLDYDKFNCPESAAFSEESEFENEDFVAPLLSMFAVSDDYDFNNPACENSWICRPNVAPSSIEIYQNEAIAEWNNSLLVTSLKRGRIYRLKLDDEGRNMVGDTTQHFYTRNRYRDIAVDPSGEAFYMITDDAGRLSTQNDLGLVNDLDDPGMILEFRLKPAVSLVDNEITSNIQVYPNPVTDVLNIAMENTRYTNVQLLNSLGKVVKAMNINNVDKISIPISDVLSGIYYIKLSGETLETVRSIIISPK